MGVDLLFLVDLILVSCFFVRRKDAGVVRSTPKDIFHYQYHHHTLSFWVNVISLLPLDYVGLVVFGYEAAATLRVLRLLRIMHAPRLLRYAFADVAQVCHCVLLRFLGACARGRGVTSTCQSVPNHTSVLWPQCLHRVARRV